MNSGISRWVTGSRPRARRGRTARRVVRLSPMIDGSSRSKSGKTASTSRTRRPSAAQEEQHEQNGPHGEHREMIVMSVPMSRELNRATGDLRVVQRRSATPARRVDSPPGVVPSGNSGGAESRARLAGGQVMQHNSNGTGRGRQARPGRRLWRPGRRCRGPRREPGRGAQRDNAPQIGDVRFRDGAGAGHPFGIAVGDKRAYVSTSAGDSLPALPL